MADIEIKVHIPELLQVLASARQSLTSLLEVGLIDLDVLQDAELGLDLAHTPDFLEHLSTDGILHFSVELPDAFPASGLYVTGGNAVIMRIRCEGSRVENAPYRLVFEAHSPLLGQLHGWAGGNGMLCFTQQQVTAIKAFNDAIEYFSKPAGNTTMAPGIETGNAPN